MSEYIITYELRKPGQSYDGLWNALRSINANRIMNSVWLLSSEYTRDEIYQKLLPHIDTNDKLLIAETTHFSASFSDRHIMESHIRILEKKLQQLSKQMNSVA